MLSPTWFSHFLKFAPSPPPHATRLRSVAGSYGWENRHARAARAFERGETCGISQRLPSIKHGTCQFCFSHWAELLPLLYFFILKRRRGLAFVANVQCSPCRLPAVPAVVYHLALFAAVTKHAIGFFSTHTRVCTPRTCHFFSHWILFQCCFNNISTPQLLDNCFAAIFLCRKTRCQVKAFLFSFWFLRPYKNSVVDCS